MKESWTPQQNKEMVARRIKEKYSSGIEQCCLFFCLYFFCLSCPDFVFLFLLSFKLVDSHGRKGSSATDSSL